MFCLLRLLIFEFSAFALLCQCSFIAFLFFWKRFSFLCHWYLGFAIGMSPLGAWIAVRGEFSLFPIFMSIILALWMGGFDINIRHKMKRLIKIWDCTQFQQSLVERKSKNCSLSHIMMLCLCCIWVLL